MRYAGIIYDDTAAAPGLSLTLFTQGCPFHCKGCHNPETWDYEGGYEYNEEVQNKILQSLNANGVLRNLCIMGGEPLLPQNCDTLLELCTAARDLYKDVKIYIWTGYEYDDLLKRESILSNLLNLVDVIIAGPYIEEKRDITNRWCGSSNQQVIYIHGGNE